MSTMQSRREQRILREQQPSTVSLVPALITERRRMLEARLRQAQADTRPIRTSTRTQAPSYSGAELAEPAVRKGADDHMARPSRRGDVLYYRDGRQEVMG